MVYAVQFLGSDLFASDIVQMVFHAGLMVKFVLFVLFFFSLTSWAIIFMKLRLLKKFRDENESFLELFSSSREISKLYLESKIYNFSPLAKIFRTGYAEFNRSKMLQDNPDENKILQSQQPVIDNVQRAVRKVLSTQTSRLERGLTFLATTGNTSPAFQIETGNFISDFMGLLERGLMRRASIERARGE
jgi:biopolymer transport protein TolQ